MAREDIQITKDIHSNGQEAVLQHPLVLHNEEGTITPTNTRSLILFHFKPHSEFLCGWGAAFVNITLTFPINKIMFRQQLHGVRSVKAIVQIKNEGIRNLYRGLLSPLLQKTTSMAIMFGIYYECQRWLHEQVPSMWVPETRAISALIAGTAEASLCPFERIQVLMQDRNYQHRFSNTFHAFRELRHYGFREYYRGLSAILLRNGPSNVPFFLTRDYLQETLPPAQSTAQKFAQDFLSGAFLGAMLSTLFYPLNVVKVRMQSHLGGEFEGVLVIFKKLMEERNYSFRKLFRGVPINYTRSFISWGIINATYEFLMKNIFNENGKYMTSS